MRSMGKKGFTLVEIVVVMVVVGILAAITVPSLAKYIDDGKKRDCEINRKALLARLESDRALNPGAVMAGVLAENTDISCPSRENLKRFRGLRRKRECSSLLSWKV